MGFITAIDKAINKDHYSNEAEKEREHQEEMNKQFMDMLDKQMGEFDQQNAQIWGMVGDSKAQNDDMWGGYFPQGGPNFDQGGNAAFDRGAGYSFDSVVQPGPNFDQTGGATYGGGQLPALPAGTDPYAGIPGGSGSGTTGDPTAGFGQAGIDNSWAMNTGGMFNMNDLIGYFDQRIAEQNRPASIGDQPAQGNRGSDGQTTIIVIQNGAEPPARPAGGSPSDPVPTTAAIKGEIEDLSLKLEDAVDKGLISQNEADRLMRDLQDRAGGLETPKETDDTVAVDQGRVWGDPHFVGADGGKYDVQGEAGKTYNILSDRGIQVNAQFDEWASPGSGKTVMGEIGISLGEDQVKFDKSGTLTINGEEVGDGTYLDGAVELKDGKLSVQGGEYSFDVETRQHANGDHLNIENIRSDNANADGVLPSGLWGVTVDGDGEARKGDAGKGTQGGGAIEDVDGTRTERGDREAVKDYEVDGLFDTEFDAHNQFSDPKAEDKTAIADDIDRISGQLGELEAIQKQAGSVLQELDLRVERGEISQEAADQVRKDIETGLDAAKKAVLDPGDENSVFGKEFSDGDILGNVMSNLEAIDQNLNVLAKRDAEADAKVDSLQPIADMTSNPVVDKVIGDAIDKIEGDKVEDQLKTLEWT